MFANSLLLRVVYFFFRRAGVDAANLTINSQSQQNTWSLDCSLLRVVNKRRHNNSGNVIQKDIEPFRFVNTKTVVKTSFEVGMGKKKNVFLGTWLDNIGHLRYL